MTMQLFKAMDVNGTDLIKNKIYVGNDADVDGIDSFVLIAKTGKLFDADRFELLDDDQNPDTPQKLVDVSGLMGLFTANKVYPIDSAWDTESNTYFLLKNDIGEWDYLKASRFAPVAPAVAPRPVVADSQFGHVQVINNHKPVNAGDLKRVKRVKEGSVYALARDWNYSQDFAWLVNDEGAVEDYRKARLLRVVPAPVVPVVTGWVALR